VWIFYSHRDIIRVQLFERSGQTSIYSQLPPSLSAQVSLASSLSEELSEAAANTTSSDELDGVERRMMDRGHMSQHGLSLFLREAMVGLGGHDHDGESFAVAEFENIPTELAHLFLGDLNDFMMFIKFLEEHLPFTRVLDTFRAHHGAAGTHRHHHIGVVNGIPLDVRTSKRDQIFVAKLVDPFLGDLAMGTFRQGNISTTTGAIEDQDTGTFEVFGFFPFPDQVHGTGVPTTRGKVTYQIVPAFRLTAGTLHRVQDEGPLVIVTPCFPSRVGREPIIGETRVRGTVVLPVLK